MVVADERVGCDLRNAAKRVQMRVHGQSWWKDISHRNHTHPPKP